jgi:hypothetical protein
MPTVALVPHAQAFAVSAVRLALFVTNNELAIAAVRDRGEARRARSHCWGQSASSGLAERGGGSWLELLDFG